MGWQNPPMPWAELERRLSGRPSVPPEDGPVTRKRKPYRPQHDVDGPATSVTPYAELHCHSNFSFLDGASHPEDLVAEAALRGMPALAITDHGGLYAAVRLWKAVGQTRTDAARDAGLSPVEAIIGVELAIPRGEGELRTARRGRRLNDPVRGVKASRGWPGGLHAVPIPGDHLVLLARDPAGYTALSRPVSRGHLAGEKQFPVFERSLVEAVLDAIYAAFSEGWSDPAGTENCYPHHANEPSSASGPSATLAQNPW